MEITIGNFKCGIVQSNNVVKDGFSFSLPAYQYCCCCCKCSPAIDKHPDVFVP